MLALISKIIIGVCIFALFTSILINFAEAKSNNVKKQKKSIVETGTMTLFFIGFASLLWFGIGNIDVGISLLYILAPIGLLMISFGCIFNIMGRFHLGSNWANQVKIYDKQTLVRTGVYGIVRHPLYASLMLMFYGACLVFPNYIAFLANTLIFIPFMYYRAKQEEDLLTKRFKEYPDYQKEVGMFFPRVIK